MTILMGGAAIGAAVLLGVGSRAVNTVSQGLLVKSFEVLFSVLHALYQAFPLHLKDVGRHSLLIFLLLE